MRCGSNVKAANFVRPQLRNLYGAIRGSTIYVIMNAVQLSIASLCLSQIGIPAARQVRLKNFPACSLIHEACRP